MTPAGTTIGKSSSVVAAVGYVDHGARRRAGEQAGEHARADGRVAHADRLPVGRNAQAIARAERVAVDRARVDRHSGAGRAERERLPRRRRDRHDAGNVGETGFGRRREVERVHDVSGARVPVRARAGNVERGRVVDRGGVVAHPGAGLAQEAGLVVGDRAVGIRSDVEQEVAALGHGLDEHGDDLGRGEEVGDRLVAVHAERRTQAPAHLPRPVGRDRRHVVLEGDEVGIRREEAVVEQHVETVCSRVLPGFVHDPVGAPVPTRMSPMTVAPQHRGLEALDQLADLRTHERVDVAVDVGIVGVAPVEQRVVAAELVSAAAHRVGELGDDVALRAEDDGVAIGVGGVPPAEAVVVFRDVHEVAHAGVVEELRVGVGVEVLERELRDEIVEGLPAEVLAVPGDDLRHRARRVQHHVGLGLEKAPIPVGVLVQRRERGDGGDVGVHEHAVASGAEHGDSLHYRRRPMSRRGDQVVITNRKARHDYFVLDAYECGVMLKGPEVKSIRNGRANLQDAYARVEDGEVWMFGMHISPYEFSRGELDPVRKRKLLLHGREIAEIARATEEKGVTLVPLARLLQGRPLQGRDRDRPGQGALRQAPGDRDTRLQARHRA